MTRDTWLTIISNTHVIGHVFDLELPLAGRQGRALLELRGAEQAVDDAEAEDVGGLRLPADHDGVGLLVRLLHDHVLDQRLGGDGTRVVGEGGVLGGADHEVAGAAAELLGGRRQGPRHRAALPRPLPRPRPSRLMRVEPRPSGICVPDTPALTVRTPGCWPAPCPTSILSSVTMSPDWGPDLTLKAGRPLAGGRGSGRGWAGEGWRCLGVMLPGPALGEEDTTTSGGTRGRGLRLSTDWAPEAGAAEAEGATKRREGGVVAGGAQLRSEERGGE